jgi:hypothetical protein
MLNGGENTSALESELRSLAPSEPAATISKGANLLRRQGIFSGETLGWKRERYIEGVAAGASDAELVIGTAEPGVMRAYCDHVDGPHACRVEEHQILAEVMTS